MVLECLREFRSFSREDPGLAVALGVGIAERQLL